MSIEQLKLQLRAKGVKEGSVEWLRAINAAFTKGGHSTTLTRSGLRSVNRTKADADAHNKKERDWNEYTKTKLQERLQDAASKWREATGKMINHEHAAMDRVGKVGAPILLAAATAGAAPAYAAASEAVPQVLNYLGNGWRLWQAAHPVGSMVMNAAGTALALDLMAGPNGVLKTINKALAGDYPGAVLSGMGDLWNGYVAANGLSNFGNQVSSLAQLSWEPLPSMNPFVTTTTTTTTKAPYRITTKRPSVDKEALAKATQLYLEDVNGILSRMPQPKNMAEFDAMEALADKEMAQAFARYKATPTVKYSTASSRPTETVTNTSRRILFSAPYAVRPYGVPEYLPESEVVGGVRTPSTSYQGPRYSTGLSYDGLAQWRATTTPSRVTTSSTTPRGGFPTHTQAVEAAPVITANSTLLPVPGMNLYDPTPYNRTRYISVDPPYGYYAHPVYYSAEVHNPEFESWWRDNYSAGDTAYYHGRPYVFEMSPNAWRNDSNGQTLVSDTYQGNDNGDYLYVIELNGLFVPEDMSDWNTNEKKSKEVKAKANASGKTKVRHGKSNK